MAKTENPVKYLDMKKIDEKQFFDWIKSDAKYVEWAKEAITRTERRETYPRKVKLDANGNPVKKISKTTGEEYIVHEADYSKPPKVTETPISFLSLKKAFAFECLGVEKMPQKKEETFLNRFATLLGDK